jgi:adenylate cyclase
MLPLRQPQAKPRRAETPARKHIARWSYAITVALPTFLVVLFGSMSTPLLPDLSNLVFDWYQRLAPRAWDPQSPVRIVAIDDESLARIGQWPWPRSTLGQIVRKLGDLGATIVAVDIVFAEPDSSSPQQAIRSLPASSARAQLDRDLPTSQSNDIQLAEAGGAIPSVLGTILTQGSLEVDYPVKSGIATAGDDPRPFLAHFSGAVVPLPILSAKGAGLGALNWLPDRDQVVRRVPLLLALGDKIVPSFALETVRVLQDASTIVVRASNASGQSAYGAHSGVNTIKVGELEIPTDARAEMRVRYTPTEPGRFVSAWKLLAGTLDRYDIAGRVVVLGVSAAGLADQRATPVDPSVPGAEIHAQVLEEMIAGAWLARPDWAAGAELLLTLLLTLAIAVALPRVNALASAVGASLMLAALAWASWQAFSAHGMLLDPVLPGLSVALTYGSGVVWLYRDEQRRRRLVREAFGRYVSPAVVARLAEDPAKLVLGGESRVLTIMFCDVRGFTAIAERLDPQGLTRFMNEYLTPMTDAVLAQGGTLDKYIGDALMAFWNAPLDDADHARHAARAALAMVGELVSLNRRWRERAQAFGASHSGVKFGIGLATGECCVGNFGSIHRFDYSVLGDHVNLASRLEAATKLYAVDILASAATRDLAPDLAWLEVDAARVKGKTEVTRIHVLAGDARERQSAAFAALADIHERMLAAYRGGNFAPAVELAAQARGLAPPQLHELYGFYERRCRRLEQARPVGWSPITDLSAAAMPVEI